MEIDGVFQIGAPVRDARGVAGDDQRFAAAICQFLKILLRQLGYLHVNFEFLGELNDFLVAMNALVHGRSEYLQGCPSATQKRMQDIEVTIRKRDREAHKMQSP